MRKPLASPCTHFTDHILHLTPHTFLSRYTKIFLTFLLSGTVHMIAEFCEGFPLSASGALKCYCVQVIGIMLEDSVQEIWRRMGGKGGKGSENGGKEEGGEWWKKIVGFMWVTTFLLVWSAPAWFYPHILVGKESAGSKMAPWSVFGGLFKT
jgi:Membrane bound O-acyl transferase family